MSMDARLSWLKRDIVPHDTENAAADNAAAGIVLWMADGDEGCSARRIDRRATKIHLVRQAIPPAARPVGGERCQRPFGDTDDGFRHRPRKPTTAVTSPIAALANASCQNRIAPVSNAIEQRTMAISRNTSPPSKNAALCAANCVSCSSSSFA